MVSAIISALLLIVMALIIIGFIVSAWREQQRHKRRVAAAHSNIPAHPLDRHVTAILHVSNGSVVGVEKPGHAQVVALPASWYKRRRTIVSLGLLAMLLLTFFVQDSLGGGAIQSLTKGLGFTFLSNSQQSNWEPMAHP